MALRRVALEIEVEGRQAVEGDVYFLNVIFVFTLVGIFAKHLGLTGEVVFALQADTQAF